MSAPRFNPDLLEVPLYIGGKSIEEVKEELGLENVIKMASNESPAGPSPLALESAREMLKHVHRYPGVSDRDLRRKIAARQPYDICEDNIVTGNGGTDVLRMITQAFVFDGGNTVMSRATFPMYRILTRMFGGTPKLVDPILNGRHDLDGILEHIDSDTRIVFLCSPNNPTGHIIREQELDDFMEKVPENIIVVMDEAYYDYVTDPKYADSLKYVRDERNLLAVRSFSKTAGLAGLRVGYLIGSEELANYIRHTRLPFHTSDVALAAAAASMDDQTYHEMQQKLIFDERDYLYRSMCEMGLKCLQSQTNFVCLEESPINAVQLTEALLRRGFIVRAMGGFGMPDAIRISLGSPEENRRFVKTLREILEARNEW